MPDIFTTGIPLASLGSRALELGTQLDTSPLIPREDPSHLQSNHIEKDEAAAALRSLDNWTDPADRAILKKFANILGVENSPPKKKEWSERAAPDPKWTSALLDAVPIGQYVFVSDRRRGVLRYDTVNDVWSQLARPWGGRHRWQSSAIAELDGKLAIIGTYPRQMGPAWGAARLYDPATGVYSNLPRFAHRTNAAVASHDGKLYVFGGSKYSNEQSVGYGTPVDAAQVYDAATGQISALPPLPEARYGAKAVALGENIYVIGGRGLVAGSSKRIDVFDTTTGRWQEPITMATPRTYQTAWVDGGKIQISGGATFPATRLDSRGTVSSAMFEYYKDVDSSTETIDPVAEDRHTRQGVPLPIGGRQSGVAAMVDDALYVVSLEEARPGHGKNPCLQVFAEDEEPAPSTVVNITNVDNSITVVNDIDVILTSITQTSEVNIVDVTNNNIEINNDITNQVFDIDVLNYQSLRENHIAVDVDANFFCRPSWNDQPLMSVGQDADGKRYLFGIPRDGLSALPKSAQLWLCHPASGRSVAVQTDDEGRFAAELPADMSGPAYLARIDQQGHGVGAQIELP